MILGQELINSNGISQVALAFFAGLFSMIGYLIKARLDDKRELKDAKKAADHAAASADKAAANTKNVSNGFAGNVLAKLEKIDERLDAHIEWHLQKERTQQNGD